MTNADVAALFASLADLLEYRGENAFRVRAYRNASSGECRLLRVVRPAEPADGPPGHAPAHGAARFFGLS